MLPNRIPFIYGPLCATALERLPVKKPITISIKEKGDLKKIPSKFSSVVGPQQLGTNLIVLDGGSAAVWTSKDIGRALRKVRMKEGQNYTILVTSVTIEAERVILERGMKLLRVSDFIGRTDHIINAKKVRIER